jgi:hypothetical protein
VLLGALLSLFIGVVPASADHATRPHTDNLEALGHSPNPASFFHPDIAPPEINSDIAFRGNLAFHGNYDGFRIVDISDPDNPVELLHQRCNGNQGDIVVYGDVLVRSWNSPAPPRSFCDGQRVRPRFEGLHVFDISNLSNPELVASVETDCGSHTATGVPDPANDRLLIYNSPSSGACPGIDIVEVPLHDPASSSYVRFEAAGRSCHDTGVILGDVMRAACAGGNGFTVWDLDQSNLADPSFAYSTNVNTAAGVTGVSVGHSASFTFDGEVLVFGHEPGGGAQARCQASTRPSDKSMFFFDAADGTFLGMWTLPRPQTAQENCTIHNYNIVPVQDRYIAVSGNYQAGTWVTDFTNPKNARAIAFSDPPPIVPTDLGGAWSSYWYNGFIYEGSITEGLNVFQLVDDRVAGARSFGHLNPQTQEVSF